MVEQARALSESCGRVLVVDDEPAVRRILCKMLEAEGYEVLQAPDGPEALTLLEAEDVDTVLLDVFLPKMGGLEVCIELRKRPRTAHTPIVFISAAQDRTFLRSARLAGADDFINKPFDDIELLARVRNTVRIKQYHDQIARERNQLADTVDGRTRELLEATAQLQRVKSQLEQAQHETIERLTRAAEFRDDETAHHLQRMSHYCALLGRKLGMDEYRCEMLRVASPMHDVGKIGIPDNILLKPGKLTREEFEVMKQHAEIGYRILSGSGTDLLELAASIARSHHERWDGGGYPSGLAGEEIPLEGRIAALADVFDALTSKRPYKEAWPIQKALDTLHQGAGSHFDPKLVTIFENSLDEVLEIRERYKDD